MRLIQIITAASASMLVGATLHADSALVLSKDKAKTVAKVSVAKSATSNVNMDCKYDYVGAALREKKIAIFNVDLYVATLYVSDKSKFVAKTAGSEALDSLDGMNCVAINLTLTNDITDSQMENALNDALELNDHDVDEDQFAEFLEAIADSGKLKKGTNFQIITEKATDKEFVSIQNNAGEIATVEGGKGFAKAVMSMWLGETEKLLTKTREGLILNNQ